MFSTIKAYCDARVQEFEQISDERKADLKILSDYVAAQYQKNETPKIIVICTHNSRRSHMGQLWLSIGADYYGLAALESYSGGTEATAFNPRAVTALRKVGLDIVADDEQANNPRYQVSWKDNQSAYVAFSKKYQATPNPQQGYAAVMVCTDADEKCPLVFGMDLKLALPFVDPKAFDDTELEGAKYSERCEQIAREFLYVLSLVKS